MASSLHALVFSSSNTNSPPQPRTFIELHENISLKKVRADLYEVDLSSVPLTTTDGISFLQALLDKAKKFKITLRLNNNQLSSISPEIGNLNHITFLDLSCNNLLELPSEIGQLSTLQILSCFDNSLADIPATCSNLTNLTSLNNQK